jgi:single-stranded-DNA-specific exonuclease
MAIELDQLNYTRREIEADMRAEAIKTAEKIAQHLKQPPVGVTLYDPQWHQGVIGIVASRLKEKLNRPVIVMTDIGEGFIRGSARSIHGLHVRDALHQIDIAYPDLLLKYGGHAMAAGLTLHKDDLDRFSQAFDDICRDELSDEQLRCHWVSDGMLDEADVNLQQINLIKMAMPWGQGFDAPQFDGQFELCHFQWVGNGHLKMQLKWPGTTTSVDAIYFFAADHDFQPLYGMVEVVYQPDINHWRGSSQVQLRVIAIRTLD